MNIYLPIGQISVDLMYLAILGVSVGFVSGLLGVSGGFLQTPFLIIMGIPSNVVVASQSAQVIALSTAGYFTHSKTNKGDMKMGLLMLFGGILGSTTGVYIFNVLDKLGFLDVTVKISYIILLSVIGTVMIIEIINTKRNAKKGIRKKLHNHMAFHGWPFKYKFHRSRLYISIIPPLIISFVIGNLSALMGIGGNFMLIPAMIYLLGMHTSVVVVTTLFQSIFVAVNSSFWQATMNKNVDIVLAIVLIIGGVIGTKIGVKAFNKFNPIQIRFILASVIIIVAFSLIYNVTSAPENIFSITRIAK